MLSWVMFICIEYDTILSLITPHACGRGKVIVSIVVVVDAFHTKFARSRGQGVIASNNIIYRNYVRNGEKSTVFSFSTRAYAGQGLSIKRLQIVLFFLSAMSINCAYLDHTSCFDCACSRSIDGSSSQKCTADVRKCSIALQCMWGMSSSKYAGCSYKILLIL